MKFQCQNPACGKVFLYTAKKTDLGKEGDFSLEWHVCPYCQSLDFTEYMEPPTPQPDVEAVYVYELTTGPQVELDKLLAEGYKIANRYSKQYHLEKPKKTEA
jgi:hypothetical protein